MPRRLSERFAMMEIMAGSSSDDLRAWDMVASAYASRVGVQGDATYERFRSFIWRNLGEIEDLSVLDLGCGHGWLSGEIHERGGNMIGVDGSKALLEIARRKHPEIRFEHADLTAGLPGELEMIGFDRIVSHMVVMDLPELSRLASSLARCLRPGGRVVITMTHPAFFMQSPHEDPESGECFRKVRGYLQHEQWWVESFGGHRHHHRPLGFYVNWLATGGLGVVELYEPPVPLSAPPSEWSGCDRWFVSIPTMLGLVATPTVAS